MLTREEIHTKIETAVLRAKELGYTIWDYCPLLNPQDKTCCPLASLGVDYAYFHNDGFIPIAKAVLDVSEDWAWNFASGFDADESYVNQPNVAWIEDAQSMGAYFRRYLDKY